MSLKPVRDYVWDQITIGAPFTLHNC
jgi:hypothetical protein